MRTLIDGYNLMHAAGLVRGKLVGKQLEGARERLLKRIAFHLSKDERAQTIVIFDAKAAPAMASREEHLEGIRVLYPEPGHEADELIEELIRQEVNPRKLRIVSSDRRLHRAARERMAQAVASDRFLDELDDRRVRRERDDASAARVPAPEKRPAVPSPVAPPTAAAPGTPRTGRKATPVNEVEYWLKEFGSIEIPSEDLFDDSPLTTAVTPLVSPEPTPKTRRTETIQPLAKPPAAARWTPEFTIEPPRPAAREVPLGTRGGAPDSLTPAPPTDEDQQARELAFWQSEVSRVLNEERGSDPGDRRKRP